MCYTHGRNTQPAYGGITKTSGVQKELVDFRRWLSRLVHGELLVPGAKLHLTKGSYNPKLHPRVKKPMHGTCVCWAMLCKAPYICNSCTIWNAKAGIFKPHCLNVPHKWTWKNNTNHFKQLNIFTRSGFLFKVQLWFYSCVPLQQLFYDSYIKTQRQFLSECDFQLLSYRHFLHTAEQWIKVFKWRLL